MIIGNGLVQRAKRLSDSQHLIDSSIKLLMHFDGLNNSQVFIDATGKTVTAYGNTIISTAQSKFGGTSSYFDGNGDYLKLQPNNDFNFGAGDFTIDWWEYRISTRDQMTSIGNDGTLTGTGMLINYHDGVEGTTKIYVYWTDGTSSSYTFYQGAAKTGGWHHFAVIRKNNILYGFVDGVKILEAQNVTKSISNFANFVIGRWSPNFSSSHLNGYIDELRVSKDIARWTENFTPQSAPYSLYL